MDGFLLINKPVGPTSHDVVDKVRHIFNTKKVGHAGTLDPFADGLLILGIGRFTKELGKFQALPKQYQGTIILGSTSTTDDPEGKIIKNNAPAPERVEIEKVFLRFTGKISQVPPMFSAKKVNGKKLYKLARAGIEVPRTAVAVTIYKLNLINYSYPELRFLTVVSSGTYIRALARDIGEALGPGGYLKTLTRTAIGNCKLEEAVTLDALRLSPSKYLISELKCATLDAG